MNAKTQPNWPKTRDGITDWQAVFEDPDNGYISRVLRSGDRHALRAAVLVAIESLFSRKEDRVEVTVFAAQLEKVFATGDFQQTKEAIATLMRGIKAQRIDKAASHAAKLRQGHKVERRTKTHGDSGLTMAPFKALGLNRKEAGILFGTFFAAVAACLLALGMLVLVQYLDQAQAEKPQVPLVAHVKAPTVNPTATKRVLVQAPRESEDYQFRVNAQPIHLTIAPDHGRPFKALYLPTLYLVNDNERLTLCRNWPRVLDALNVALSRIHPAQELAGAVHLERANRLAATVINQTVGLDLVSWVSFEHASDPSQLIGRSTKACVVERTKG